MSHMTFIWSWSQITVTEIIYIKICKQVPFQDWTAVEDNFFYAQESIGPDSLAPGKD